jgi:putative membrane protein
MGIFLTWLVMAAAVYLTAAILPGIRVKSFGGALMASAVLGVLNLFLRWLLFLAIGVGTLGLGFLFAFLTLWVVDAFLLKVAAAATDSLEVDGFGWALGGALCISLLGNLGGHLLG